LDRQNGAIASMAWSPDGKRIAVAGAAPEVNVYDADTGKLVASLKGHEAGGYTVAFSPDSSTVAAGGVGGQGGVFESGVGKVKAGVCPGGVGRCDEEFAMNSMVAPAVLPPAGCNGKIHRRQDRRRYVRLLVIACALQAAFAASPVITSLQPRGAELGKGF